jgi:hypothetical protein
VEPRHLLNLASIGLDLAVNTRGELGDHGADRVDVATDHARVGKDHFRGAGIDTRQGVQQLNLPTLTGPGSRAWTVPDLVDTRS